MKLNQIPKKGLWDGIADFINENFNKIDTSVESLKDATVKNCGYFSTLEALQQSYPKAGAGSKAYVGASYPYAIYLWDDSALVWVDSGATGGEENVELGDYYTKNEMNEEFAKVDKEISNLTEALITEDEDTLFVVDKNQNVIATISEEGIKTTAYQTNECRTIDDGADDFIIADKDGNVVFRVGRNYGIPDIVSNHIISQYNKPQVSWIDDDFAILNDDNSIKEQYRLVHDWCIENNVRYDFAFIPPSYESTPDESERLRIAKMWEDENFRLLMHPIHDGWYNYPNDNEHNVEKVRKGIVGCQRYFKINNILSDGKILVYPGSSNQFTDNVDVIKRYVDCAIIASDNESNHLVDNGRFQIKRYAIDFSASKPKTRIKKDISTFINRGDWIILYTHLYNYTAETILDETTNSIANVLDVVGYINSISAIRPTEEVWRDRRFMFDYLKK